jgi:molybdopterin-guanine dinucleotide biosynthesis protein A
MGAGSTAGYVLVGGRSSRFGTDKALAEWHGEPLARWVAARVRAAAGSVTLVGSPERYRDLRLPVVADETPGLGPLGGITAALQHSHADWNLVVACDMPYVTAEFLGYLVSLAQEDAADVVMPLDGEGQDEPLCAVYARRCHGSIEVAVQRGVRKVTEAFAGLRVRRVGHAAYASLDPGGRLFANLNTTDELEAARGRHA